ncbi:TlpA family protein disulfide reductase [Mucilaginibacter myungsuensis]|uniref:TlpA family protein disulfide reductase n=1 Tax=Mucilaginibacter myungsuensis TaxID=649104 RepID=A0A929PY25_9SPHI|nr:TlpA disulfide reductase family protein [Mucilaginibacter myungsuensis]MBE9662887.1 TlpA family protein disulfide reductase [Mucilaginibacter myungsuensis]MDN3598307.1 TlpA disulfide reductase family protein [Mucilaginibacter myungsuensis]
MKHLIIPIGVVAVSLLSSFTKELAGYTSNTPGILHTDSVAKKAAITNLSFTDEGGKPHQLIDTTKKVNMVVFWASWCSPCRMEIPNLKEIYGKADTTKLRLISISVDKDKAAWIKAMKEENMPWGQVLAEGDNLVSIKKQFGFRGIPQIYFLDKKGNILESYTGFHYDNKVGLTALVKSMVEK